MGLGLGLDKIRKFNTRELSIHNMPKKICNTDSQPSHWISPSGVMCNFSAVLQFQVCSATVCTQTQPRLILVWDYLAEGDWLFSQVLPLQRLLLALLCQTAPGLLFCPKVKHISAILQLNYSPWGRPLAKFSISQRAFQLESTKV